MAPCNWPRILAINKMKKNIYRQVNPEAEMDRPSNGSVYLLDEAGAFPFGTTILIQNIQLFQT